LLVVMCAGLCACVVPAGPEWVDPPGNSPPSIHSASPAIGSALTIGTDGGEPPMVEVVLADQDTKDALFIRWIIDYPPLDATISRLAMLDILPGGDQVERPQIRFAPNCAEHLIAPGFSNHRLMLAVSDRFFEEPDQTALDRVREGNYRIEAIWLFEMDCSP
jgi:hypothetical protein